MVSCEACSGSPVVARVNDGSGPKLLCRKCVNALTRGLSVERSASKKMLKLHGIPPEQTRMYNQVFRDFDLDGSGAIDAKELATVLTKLTGKSCSLDEARQHIKAVDLNNDGEVDFEEFVQVAKRVQRDGSAVTGGFAEAVRLGTRRFLKINPVFSDATPDEEPETIYAADADADDDGDISEDSLSEDGGGPGPAAASEPFDPRKQWRKEQLANKSGGPGRSTGPVGATGDNEFDPNEPTFTQMMWFWAKKRSFQVMARVAQTHTRAENPVLKCRDEQGVIAWLQGQLREVVEKETSPSEIDYEPKQLFIKDSANLMFTLDKLFPLGSRSLRMDRAYALNLFAMESRWQEMRGTKLGTMKRPELPDWSRVKLRSVPKSLSMRRTHAPGAAVRRAQQQEALPPRRATAPPNAGGSAPISFDQLKKLRDLEASLRSEGGSSSKQPRSPTPTSGDGHIQDPHIVKVQVVAMKKGKKVSWVPSTTVANVKQAMRTWVSAKNANFGSDANAWSLYRNDQRLNEDSRISSLNLKPGEELQFK